MKNRIIAALLLSSAVISVPAFADGARYSNDPQSAPQASANVQAKTRAQVYQELASAESSGALARWNQTYRGD